MNEGESFRACVRCSVCCQRARRQDSREAEGEKGEELIQAYIMLEPSFFNPTERERGKRREEGGYSKETLSLSPFPTCSVHGGGSELMLY